ncbi:hypothetical protein NBRC111894_4555 [Sporolactobacillus inulinus]|uniref:Uncharacterized protein n=1 Tax=Sporolactobacillus inulinus TaxID=2078 RepID=A0A4Y1ZJ51_9BACL|nr:hypothetical protein NBRC111894_4555 [Sporolactobacillus inulinus]
MILIMNISSLRPENMNASSDQSISSSLAQMNLFFFEELKFT